MGSSYSHDYLPVWDPEHKILDLTREVDHTDFCQHVRGVFSDSSLTELPTNILDEISLYEQLLAPFNSLTELPAVLPLHLPHLNFLDLSFNHLTQLPDSFGLFFHLQVIRLNNNRLYKLPDSFTTLKKLEKLDLSDNRLIQLPEDFGELREIKKVNLSRNKLTFLPRSIVKCKKINVLVVDGNSCKNPPQDVCENGSNALLAYIKKHFITTDGSSTSTDTADVENVFARVRCNQVTSQNVELETSEHVKYIKVQTQTTNTPSPVKTPLLLPYDATKLTTEQLKDRIIGLIYGAAIGDAIGLSTDLLTIDECNFHYDQENLTYSQIITDQHRVHWMKGSWTSNCEHLLLCLDSLIQWAGVIDELDFAHKLVEWKQHGYLDNEFEFSQAGYTVSEVINRVTSVMDFAINPHSTAERMLRRNSNGGKIEFLDDAALPAAIVLGIPHFHNLREVISNAIRICKATHAHSHCVTANAILSCIVALVLQGKYDVSRPSDVTFLIDSARMMGEDILTEENDKRLLSKYLAPQSLENVLSFVDSSDRTNFHPFIALALGSAALRSQNDFRTTLTNIVMQGGHATMNGCIAGALLGCRTGYKKLPTDLIRNLNEKCVEMLDNRINNLLDMMGVP